MGFEDRLRRIRGQPVAADPDPPPTPVAPQAGGDSFAERLRRVSLGQPARSERPGRAPDESALAETLGAEVVAPGVLRLTRRLDSRRRHGQVLLGQGVELAFLPWQAIGTAGGSNPGRDILQADLSPEGALHASPGQGPGSASPPWLCLDTETSGLAGGTGTWAFLTGLLRPDADGWLLRQYLLTRLDAESDYLGQVAAELSLPARLVTYNGRTFDAPLLATRFRLAGQPDPLVGIAHLDLLGPTRRAFARRWPDCRLATAEARLLGFERSGDLPGSAVPAAWLGWLRRGETGPLAAVLRHNRDDLLSLAGLLPALDAVYRDPGAHGADCRAVAAACRVRDPARATQILAANRHTLDAPGLLDLARLYRRAGDWPRAIGIWETLAEAGDVEGRAALARFHEHRSRDLNRALEFAEALPDGPDRERRRGRLRLKLGLDQPDRQIELGIDPVQSSGT